MSSEKFRGPEISNLIFWIGEIDMIGSRLLEIPGLNERPLRVVLRVKPVAASTQA